MEGDTAHWPCKDSRHGRTRTIDRRQKRGEAEGCQNHAHHKPLILTSLALGRRLVAYPVESGGEGEERAVIAVTGRELRWRALASLRRESARPAALRRSQTRRDKQQARPFGLIAAVGCA